MSAVLRLTLLFVLALLLAACPDDDAQVAPEDVPVIQDQPDVGDPPDPGPELPDTPEPEDAPEPEDTPEPEDVPPPEDVPEEPDVEEVADEGEDVPDVEEDTGPPEPPFWEDLPAGYAQLHLEELEMDSDGESLDQAMTIPEGTLSFTLALSGAPENVWMRPIKMTVPPGFAVVKNQGTIACFAGCTNRIQADQILATTLFPNSPETKFKNKGKYTMRFRQFSISEINQNGGILVGPWSGTPLTVRVLYKLWEGEPETGTVDLNLFFTGAGEMTAENAPEHDRVTLMVTDLNTVLATVGISVGEVRYFNTPEDGPVAIETSLGLDSDLSELFLSSAGAPPGINVFLVSTIVKEEVVEGNTGVVLGIAGGIPGPTWLDHGSPHSGVALATDTTGGEVDKLGQVLAHELGHYLGLYHTTEKTETDFDPIEDTPEGDPVNLMHWAYGGGAELTAGQKFVMLRHPSVWLHPSEDTGDSTDTP